MTVGWTCWGAGPLWFRGVGTAWALWADHLRGPAANDNRVRL